MRYSEAAEHFGKRDVEVRGWIRDLFTAVMRQAPNRGQHGLDFWLRRGLGRGDEDGYWISLAIQVD